MPKMARITQEDVRAMALEGLQAIVDDPDTSAAVKVQAYTQMLKLAEQLKPKPEADELEQFLNE